MYGTVIQRLNGKYQVVTSGQSSTLPSQMYTSDDGQARLHLRVEAGMIWLNQLEIAKLFQTNKQNVSLHSKNIFEDRELRQDSV